MEEDVKCTAINPLREYRKRGFPRGCVLQLGWMDRFSEIGIYLYARDEIYI